MSRSGLMQFLRYGISAGGVALLYVTVYWLGLRTGVHYFVAILIAQVVAIAVAFPVYRRFVFESTGSLRSDFVRFLGVWTGGAVGGLVATPLLVELAGADPFWAQVGSILVISVASFLSHRFFTFGRRRAAPEPDLEDGGVR